MSDSRKVQILKKLLEVENVTAKELAVWLQVSSRTIRNDIKEINADLSTTDSSIELKPNKGAHLELDQENDIMNLIAYYQSETTYSMEKRIEYINSALLLSKQNIPITKLTQKLFVSESQLSLDLKRANKELKGYKLAIRSEGKKGLRLEGHEKDKRRYMVDKLKKLFLVNDHYLLSDISKKRLEKVMVQIFVESDYRINDDMLDYLVQHVCIMIYRFMLGFSIESDMQTLSEIHNSKEYHIGRKISRFIQKEFQCSLSESEIGYLTLQLLSKKQVEKSDEKDKEITAMIETILDVIYNKFSFDFHHDEELKKSLYLHMIPLMNRIRYDIELRNPLISEIKINYPLTYDLAGEVAVVLLKKYGFKLKEDEIAYLSIHFNLALERYKQSQKKSKILFILSEGTSASELLKYKFMQRFSDLVETVKFISPKKLEKEKIKEYDFVISAHQLEEDIVPYLKVSPFLDEKDCLSIETGLKNQKNNLYLIDCISSKLFFTDIEADSKAEAIMKICQRLEHLLPDLDHLYDSVMERESLLTTELGNKVAFPHPLNPMGQSTFMSVTILDKPVLWDNRFVQVIFISAISKNNEKHLDSFYSSFVEIIKDDMKITQLLTKRNFETLLKMINDTRKE